jgi:hypothetical protein
MKNNKNTTGVHPYPHISVAGHCESQIPAIHRSRKIPKITSQIKPDLP